MRKSTDPRQALLVDYSAARERAIRWLGDRYLLAKPINANRFNANGRNALPPSNGRFSLGRKGAIPSGRFLTQDRSTSCER